jgi:hypothetical protein
MLPLAVVITGGALLAGSLATGLVTQAKVSKIEHACPNDLCRPGYGLSASRGSARALATVTDVLLAAGTVVTGVGVVLWLTGSSAPTETLHAAATWRPALACAANGCMGSLSGRF